MNTSRPQERMAERAREMRMQSSQATRDRYIGQIIRGWFNELTGRYKRRGHEIRPELRTFQKFIVARLKRPVEMRADQRFRGYDNYVSDFYNNPRNYDRYDDSFEGFMCELDVFQSFMFMCSIRRSQAGAVLHSISDRLRVTGCLEFYQVDGLNLLGGAGFAKHSQDDHHTFYELQIDFFAFRRFRLGSAPLESEDQLRSRTVDHFVANLPVVRTISLSEEEQSCSICKEIYGDPRPSTAAYRSDTNDKTPTSTNAPDKEPAVRLHCQHVFGKTCLKDWLMSSKKATCPMCRANIDL
ncbi:hypothetical protein MMC07_008331 [Pseudocyphellaria aurata]|nr:hypothetical protein [Pseudocyphellaria aurata]